MTSKIVPMEPTRAMIVAAVMAFDEVEEDNKFILPIWRAMYDAAPSMEKPAAATQDADDLVARLRECVETLESARQVQDAALAVMRNDFRECAERAEAAEAERDRLREELAEIVCGPSTDAVGGTNNDA